VETRGHYEREGTGAGVGLKEGSSEKGEGGGSGTQGKGAGGGTTKRGGGATTDL